MSTKLYVGNLPYQTTEADLQTLFESSGQVSSISVVRDRATGQARGFALVEMSDSEGAQNAIKTLDRFEYGGLPAWTVENSAIAQWISRHRGQTAGGPPADGW